MRRRRRGGGGGDISGGGGDGGGDDGALTVVAAVVVVVVVLPRRRIQQQAAPLGALPFALLLDADLVLGCPGGRRAAARLDPLHIGPSIRLWFAGAQPPTRIAVFASNNRSKLDLLLDATCCWMRLT